MHVISRKRNSGKTTMLLHAMCLPTYIDAYYVAYKRASAKRAFELSEKLGLDLGAHRFIGIVDLSVKPYRKLFVDDIDYVAGNGDLGCFSGHKIELATASAHTKI